MDDAASLGMTDRIIDAWMQHPTERMSAHEMFASLRRWTAWPSAITPQMTIASMDQAGVSAGLAAAWCAPHGWMISHEEVAAIAKSYPGRILWRGLGQHQQTDGGGAGTSTCDQRTGFQGAKGRALALELAAE
jgi:hypothetical protein